MINCLIFNKAVLDVAILQDGTTCRMGSISVMPVLITCIVGKASHTVSKVSAKSG